MSGAEAALRAARLGDEVVHGFGLLGMVAGALIGAAVAAAIVAAGVATGGLALVAIIGGCIAGGGLAGGALARGISTAANLPGPTTGVLALAGPTRVTVNSRAALRAGVDYASSCNGLPFNHLYKPGPVLIAQGSRTVTINGMPMARLEMQLECGAKIKTGSENVTVGGPTATVVEINDNEHLVETALQVVGFVALGAAGLGALAAGALAFGGFAAITVGSFVGMNALHDWGESLGPGYGDIMVGVAGFALLGFGAKAATKTSLAANRAAPGPVNLMRGNDPFFLNASKRSDVDLNGFFDVIAHGSPNKIQVQTAKGQILVDHRIAARLIEQSPGYNGQNVRLLSCSTGATDTGFAQNLANKLGVEVHAPTDVLWAYPNGRMLVAPLTPSGPNLSNPGAFRVFTPKALP